MHLFFLCGSSAVGKTTFLESLSKEQSVNVVRMSARDVRAVLGNPSYEDLQTSRSLSQNHQQEVMKAFIKIIRLTIKNRMKGETVVFERNLLDVVGYAAGLGCEPNFIERLYNEQQNIMKEFAGHPRVSSLNVMYFKIDPSYEYAWEEARPSVYVRDACDGLINRRVERSVSAFKGNLTVFKTAKEVAERATKVVLNTI